MQVCVALADHPVVLRRTAMGAVVFLLAYATAYGDTLTIAHVSGGTTRHVHVAHATSGMMLLSVQIPLTKATGHAGQQWPLHFQTTLFGAPAAELPFPFVPVQFPYYTFVDKQHMCSVCSPPLLLCGQSGHVLVVQFPYYTFVGKQHMRLLCSFPTTPLWTSSTCTCCAVSLLHLCGQAAHVLGGLAVLCYLLFCVLPHVLPHRGGQASTQVVAGLCCFGQVGAENKLNELACPVPPSMFQS